MAIGEDGRADFNAVRHELLRSPERLFYFAFDILFRGALDLRSLSLEKRREYLHAGLSEAGAPWLASVAVVPDGVKLLAECEKIGFEGVVSKRRDCRTDRGAAAIGSRRAASVGALRMQGVENEKA